MKPAILWSLLSLLSFTAFTAEAPAPPPITIDVGPGKELRVTVPHVNKDDLVDIVSSFFTKDDQQARAKFKSLVGQSSQLTFILTTHTDPRKAVPCPTNNLTDAQWGRLAEDLVKAALPEMVNALTNAATNTPAKPR